MRRIRERERERDREMRVCTHDMHAYIHASMDAHPPHIGILERGRKKTKDCFLRNARKLLDVNTYTF